MNTIITVLLTIIIIILIYFNRNPKVVFVDNPTPEVVVKDPKERPKAVIITQQPFLTKIRDPKDFILGRWVKLGIAYSDGLEDSEKPFIVNVLQLNIDPSRDLYEYKAIDKNGFEYPIVIDKPELENNDTFFLKELNRTFKLTKDSDYVWSYL